MLKKLIKQLLVSQVKRHEFIKRRLSNILRDASPTNVIILDHSVSPRPRYGIDNPHPLLYELINSKREDYKFRLSSFLQFKPYLVRIEKDPNPLAQNLPNWRNEFMPGLDAVALYSFITMNNPKRFFEIGSGNSTRFAKQAIRDHQLQTTITSFDPRPPAEIDDICDQSIRMALEDCNPETFNQLEAGDILFVDGTHRVFTNSDATVVFLEILPVLKPGVFIQIHDICLPYDYPAEWSQRFYSEQYLLASYILAQTSLFEIILPNAFVSWDQELRDVLDPLFSDPAMIGVERYGGSFWIRTRQLGEMIGTPKLSGRIPLCKL